MKDSLIPSLKLKISVEVRVHQVGVDWSWMLGFASWEKIKRKLKLEKLGILEVHLVELSWFLAS